MVFMVHTYCVRDGLVQASIFLLTRAVFKAKGTWEEDEEYVRVGGGGWRVCESEDSTRNGERKQRGHIRRGRRRKKSEDTPEEVTRQTKEQEVMVTSKGESRQCVW